jgi:hypothetical protein
MRLLAFPFSWLLLVLICWTIDVNPDDSRLMSLAASWQTRQIR